MILQFAEYDQSAHSASLIPHHNCCTSERQADPRKRDRLGRHVDEVFSEIGVLEFCIQGVGYAGGYLARAFRQYIAERGFGDPERVLGRDARERRSRSKEPVTADVCGA